MEIAQLKLLKAVAETGSISRAAQRLHCVQSNVSMRLKQLETQLNTELFVRERKRLQISPAGSLLLEYANRLIEIADEAQARISGLDSASELRLASMETTAAVRLPNLLARFHKKLPGVRLTLETGPTDQVLELVASRKADAGFVAGRPNPAEFESELFCREKLVLLTHSQYSQVKTPADIANHTMLVFRNGCNYRRILERWFQASGFTPQRMLEFGSFQAIHACVAAGMGVGLLPESAVKLLPGKLDVRTHPIDGALGVSETYLVWKRHGWRNVALDEFRVLAAREHQRSPALG
jgi:DNA-binding transcriptional LysR family regulator